MPIVPPHSHREFRAAAPARVGWYPYIYRGTDVSVDPGPGGWAVEVGGGGVRTLAFSKTDENGEPRAVTLLQAGDTITITDDPGTPPVSGWVRYVLTSDPVDNGTWATATALRTDTIGSSNPPPVGTVVRVYTTWSASGPALDARYVKRAGDTMTGNLHLTGANPLLNVEATLGGNANLNLKATTSGNAVQKYAADGSESATNHYFNAIRRWKESVTKNSWSIQAYNTSGTYVNSPFTVDNLSAEVRGITFTASAAPTQTNHLTRKDYVDLKAPLASPALTGTPTAPTASSGTSSTQIATTAYVNARSANAQGMTTFDSLTISGSTTYTLATLTITAVPYPRTVLVWARGEMGSTVAGTRFDLDTVMSAGGSTLINGLDIGPDDGSGRYLITSPGIYTLPANATGTVRAQARRVYGGNTGFATYFSCALMYTALAA